MIFVDSIEHLDVSKYLVLKNLLPHFDNEMSILMF